VYTAAEDIDNTHNRCSKPIVD